MVSSMSHCRNFSPSLISIHSGTIKNDWADTHKQYSVLEQHCLFWDRDGDGYIWPLDTYRGFHELG
jgi:hypothetical protein